MIDHFLHTVLLTSGFFFLIWLWSLALRDASIVDVFWGPGFGLIALYGLTLTDEVTLRAGIVTALVTLWSARLGLYLAVRFRGHKGEDARYAKMRANRPGRFWIWSLYMVFALQAVLMWIISLPLQVVQIVPQPEELGWVDYAGILIFTAGFWMEATADRQLAAFKKDPANKGKVMDKGLWAWSRHPNYFGEMLVWWGLFVIVLGAGPLVAWTIVSPLLVTFLLLRVSGVPMLEKGLSETKEGYADYIARTSSFIPLPPKKKAG